MCLESFIDNNGGKQASAAQSIFISRINILLILFFNHIEYCLPLRKIMKNTEQASIELFLDK